MLPIAFSPNDVASATGGAAAVLTYPAAIGQSHVLWGICWSYSAAPTGGSLQIEDGSANIVFGPIPITAAGTGSIIFTQPMQSAAPDVALIITLAAPGGVITSKITGIGHFLTSNGTTG